MIFYYHTKTIHIRNEGDNFALMTLGDKIRKIREDKKLTQEDIAFEVGVNANSISRIERDLTDVNFSRLTQIAGALNMTVAEILAYQEPNPLEAEVKKLKELLEKKDAELRQAEKELLLKEKEINQLHKKLLKYAEKG